MIARTIVLSSIVACADLKLSNDPQCTKEGKQCSSDKTQVIYCTGENGNSYVIRTCRNHEVCEDVGGNVECKNSDGGGGQANDPPFVCTGSGAFPHPYNCSTAYMCSSQGKEPDLICTCPDGQLLSMNDYFQCKGNDSEDCGCPYKNRCKDGAIRGTFGQGCHMGYYYGCSYSPEKGLIPSVYRCPPGMVFVNDKCQDPLILESISSLLARDSQGPKCEKYYSNAECKKEDNVRCEKPNELVPHSDPRCFYFCDANGEPQLKKCPSRTEFKCVRGVCGCVQVQLRGLNLEE